MLTTDLAAVSAKGPQQPRPLPTSVRVDGAAAGHDREDPWLLALLSRRSRLARTSLHLLSHGREDGEAVDRDLEAVEVLISRRWPVFYAEASLLWPEEDCQALHSPELQPAPDCHLCRVGVQHG